MFSDEKFREAVSKRGESMPSVAGYLSIDESTLWRKRTGKSDFDLSEIQKIRDLLKLGKRESESIFFGD